MKSSFEGDMQIELGSWTESRLDKLLQQASTRKDSGDRIKFLSGSFLGTGYKESTLIGDDKTREVLIINLHKVDCFTFIDYIEAMRLSRSFQVFLKRIQHVRYRGGTVSYESRKHFFTDWLADESRSVEDVTERIGGEKLKREVKKLNLKENGALLLPGLPVIEREIKYLPSESIDRTILDDLLTGDYAGIYSPIQGLDVSHVGIIIKEESDTIFRHASSQKQLLKVVDQDFLEYINGKPGLVILRPNDNSISDKSA